MNLTGASFPLLMCHVFNVTLYKHIFIFRKGKCFFVSLLYIIHRWFIHVALGACYECILLHEWIMDEWYITELTKKTEHFPFPKINICLYRVTFNTWIYSNMGIATLWLSMLKCKAVFLTQWSIGSRRKSWSWAEGWRHWRHCRGHGGHPGAGGGGGSGIDVHVAARALQGARRRGSSGRPRSFGWKMKKHHVCLIQELKNFFSRKNLKIIKSTHFHSHKPANDVKKKAMCPYVLLCCFQTCFSQTRVDWGHKKKNICKKQKLLQETQENN